MLLKELRALGRLELSHLSQLPEPSTVSAESIKVEVDALLKHVLSKDQSWLLLHGENEVDEDSYRKFAEILERRKCSEPIAYIIGEREFYGMPFTVGPGVLIPRPETELVVEVALKHFSSKPESFYILDLCSGSGAILLAIANQLRELYGEDYLSQGELVGSDISDEALIIAKANSVRFGLDRCVSLIKSDLLAQVTIDVENVAVGFTANPPYVEDSFDLPIDIERYEPKIALRAGVDGLDVIQRIIFQLAPFIRKGAFLVMEIGENQAVAIGRVLREAGLTNFHFHNDLFGKTRVLEVIK